MTSGPWSVKGIDPKAREIAKDLARRSGQTLGEWLNQRIVDGDAAPVEPSAPQDVAPSATLQQMEEALSARSAVRAASPDLTRIATALEDLTERLEAAEQRSGEAIVAVDQTVRDALTRLDRLEGGGSGLMGRVEGALSVVREEQGRADERLARIERNEAKRVEALKGLEQAILRVLPAKSIDTSAEITERLTSSEARTRDALSRLEHTLQSLDKRVADAESRVAGTTDQGLAALDHSDRRLERLARDLTQRVEDLRLEMTERLNRAVASERLDVVEEAISQLAAQVDDAEKSSARALDRMSREMLSMADGISKRVADVESRDREVATHFGEEVARLTETVEERLARADIANADALQKISAEIGRVAERLNEKIIRTEARVADVAEENIRQGRLWHEKAKLQTDVLSQELAERLRQSEARTAQWMAEAQAKIETSLAQRTSAAQPLSVPKSTLAAPPAPEAPPPPFIAAETAPAPSLRAPDPAPPPPPSFVEDEDEFVDLPRPARQAAPPAPPPPAEPVPVPAPVAPKIEPPRAASPPPTVDPNDPFLEPFLDDEFDEPPMPFAGSGRQAHAAIFDDEPPARPRAAESFFDDGPADPRPSSTRDLIAQARDAARAARETKAERNADRKGEGNEPRTSAFSLSLSKKKKADNTVGTVAMLLAVGVVGVGGVATLGARLLADHDREIAAQAGGPPSPNTLPRNATAPAPESGSGQLALASTANDTKIDPAQGASPAASDETRTLYEDAARGVDEGDPAAVKSMIRAAELGYPQAQFHLSNLYAKGVPGLEKDPVKSRQWVERAAQAGLPNAMFNLAVQTFFGRGGPKDQSAAAEWFRRAATAGNTDAQYNLAQLYETGNGVPKNLSQAYVWYLIAAASGDKEGKAKAAKIGAVLTPELRNSAEKLAQAFAPQSQVQAATPSTSSSSR